jgi:hypothetical protein
MRLENREAVQPANTSQMNGILTIAVSGNTQPSRPAMDLWITATCPEVRLDK